MPHNTKIHKKVKQNTLLQKKAVLGYLQLPSQTNIGFSLLKTAMIPMEYKGLPIENQILLFSPGFDPAPSSLLHFTNLQL